MNKRIKVIAGAAVVGLVAAGGAFAFWTAGGAGTGSVTTDTTQALVITQTAPVTKLVPGGGPIVLEGTISNPNASEVKISGITATVGTLPAGCNAADFVFTGTVPAITVPANATAAPWSGLSISLTNTAANQDACKGLAVPLVFTVGAPAATPPSAVGIISPYDFTPGAVRTLHLVLAGQAPSTPVSIMCALVEKAPAGTATNALGALDITVPAMPGTAGYACQVSMNTVVIATFQG